VARLGVLRHPRIGPCHSASPCRSISLSLRLSITPSPHRTQCTPHGPRGNYAGAVAEAGCVEVGCEVAGCVVLPGAPSLPRNSRLSVVARAAAKATGHWTDQALDKLVRDIESGLFKSIDEIDRLIEGGDSKLQLIFNTSDPPAIARRFRTAGSVDADIAA